MNAEAEQLAAEFHAWWMDVWRRPWAMPGPAPFETSQEWAAGFAAGYFDTDPPETLHGLGGWLAFVMCDGTKATWP